MDYVAGVIELIGVLLVGNLCRHGFLLCLLCNLLWILVAVQTGVYGLILVSVVMAVANVRNFVLWSRRSHGSSREAVHLA